MPVLFSQAPNVVTSPQADFQVTDDLDVGDDAAVGGDLAVTGTLAVTGAATMASTLGVTGALTAAGGIVLGSGDDITIDGAGSGVKLGQAGSKIGVFGATPVVQPTALTAGLTAITHTAPGTPDYALQNLVQNTGFGFATADEGNTVLKVLVNAVARIAELETKLTALGLLHT